jgi:tetratricopeptide (TPR) repeat protein
MITRCRTDALAAALLLLLVAMPAAADSKEFKAAYVAAKALYDAGEFEEALAAFERARTIEPAPEAIYSIARCQHRLGRLTEAAAAYETFLAAAPGHKGVPAARAFLVEVLDTLGREALALGDAAAARTALARARDVYAVLDPALADATAAGLLAGLGDALAALGARDEAIRSYGGALAAALTPDRRVAVEARLRDLVSPAPAETGPASAPASAPAPAHPFPPSSAPATPPATAAAPALAAPAARRPVTARPAFWIGVGGAAGVVAAVITAIALVRPATDLGYHVLDFHP